jgi:hypothetical protein
MAHRIGNGFLSSDGVETSVANQEIIPSPPANFTKPYSLYKFTFYNLAPVNVKINDQFTIFLDAYQNFEIEEIDKPIVSFEILDAGVQYNWIGYY